MNPLIAEGRQPMSQPETPDQDATKSQMERADVNEAQKKKHKRPEDLWDPRQWLEQQYTRIDKQFGAEPENSEEKASELPHRPEG